MDIHFKRVFPDTQCRYLGHTGRSGFIQEREREMFYLTTHSTHFIYGYMASDITFIAHCQADYCPMCTLILCILL